jgi:integrase
VLGKGRRPRAVPFGPKTGQALLRYLRVRASDKWAYHDRLWLAEKGRGPLTPNGIKLMLRRRGRVAGVNDAIGRNLHAHLGRHGSPRRCPSATAVLQPTNVRMRLLGA